jgi:serine/threonine protein kinase
MTSTFVATAEYMPPEMLNRRPYTRSVDWWSLGILAFELVTGRPPFQSDNQNRLYRMISQEPVKFPRFVTDDAQDLIGRLLDRDPEARLGAGELDAQEILSHPWFAELDLDKVARREVEPPWVPPTGVDDDASSPGMGLGIGRVAAPNAFSAFTCIVSAESPEERHGSMSSSSGGGE